MQIRELKARAHKLEPVVIIGAKGLTDEVLAEIDRALKAHELIKVRAVLERDQRDAALKQVCESTGAQPVQQVGKIFVLYRKRNP
ncbi:MAG: YhbY family RNA-binding protein [Betaproteobacteria bacterium]